MNLPPTVPLADYIAGVQRLLTPPRVSKFNRISWQDLDLPGPELEYLIDGWLTRNEKSIIGGPSQSGKSFLAVHAALAISRGVDFFGAKVMAPGLVVYQAGEGGLGIKRRLRAYRTEFGVGAQDRVPFELITSKIDLYHPEGDTTAFIDEIKAACADYPGVPLQAVFIDTLATAQGGADENSGKDMGTVLANVDRIRAETGAHVCLVHHMNASGAKIRGHTSVYSNVDQVILVDHDKETGIRTAILDKQKDDENGIRLRFKLHSVLLGLRAPDNKKITSCVCQIVEAEKGDKNALDKSGFRLNSSEDEAFRALMKALADHGRPRPAGRAEIPDRVTVVSYAEWREAFRSIMSDPEMSDDAVKAALGRGGKSLMRFGILGRVNKAGPSAAEQSFVWWTGKPVRGEEKLFKDERGPRRPPSNVVPIRADPEDLNPGHDPDDELKF